MRTKRPNSDHRMAYPGCRIPLAFFLAAASKGGRLNVLSNTKSYSNLRRPNARRGLQPAEPWLD